MIQIKNGKLQVGHTILFEDLTLTLPFHAKVGVVGRNGAGKSTLLKVLAGQMNLTEGVVYLDKKKKIAYMPQEMVMNSTKTVFQEAYAVFQEFTDKEMRMREIEKCLEDENNQAVEIIQEYAELQQSLALFDKRIAINKTKTILDGLGFHASLQEQIVSRLSVGWKMRVLLAQLLLMEAEFYLFDEPTNHLDMVAKEWFLSFLKNGKFGYLLVTHDIYFLENACDLLLELAHGKGHLYHGNLSTYLIYKEEQREIALAARARQEKEIAKKQATIDAFRYTPSKAKMVQSMIKQLERIELIDIEPEIGTISMKFPPTLAPGKEVLKVNNVAYAYDGKQIFSAVNFEVMRGEKIALLAANGVGKTTLFKLIQGAAPLQKGTITFGHNVKPVFFEQDQSRVLISTNTIMQEIQQVAPNVSDSLIRSMLGSFLFSGDDIFKKIEVLSGGEKNRVAMVKVLLQQGNFLVLDEPTNHLDMYAQDILLQALRQFDGTILLVSHDHTFIQQMATSLIELTPHGVYRHNGDYESYLYMKRQQKNEHISPAEEKRENIKTVALQDHAKERRKQIAALESRINKLESEVRKITDQFALFEYGTVDYHKVEKKYHELNNELAQKMSEWELLMQK